MQNGSYEGNGMSEMLERARQSYLVLIKITDLPPTKIFIHFGRER